jgi:hypothetical protein
MHSLRFADKLFVSIKTANSCIYKKLLWHQSNHEQLDFQIIFSTNILTHLFENSF